MQRFFLFFSFVLIVLFTSGCDDTTQDPIVQDVTGIAIVDTNSSLRSTQNTLSLHAVAYYNDASTSDVTDTVIWRVSDYSKATIYGGIASPIANFDDNDTNLTVSIQYRGLEDQTTLRLIGLRKLDIDDSDIADPLAIDTNRTYVFKAVGTYSDAASLPIDENNSKNVFWFVTGSAQIIEVANGTATISFSSGDANVTVVSFDVNASKSYTIP